MDGEVVCVVYNVNFSEALVIVYGVVEATCVIDGVVARVFDSIVSGVIVGVTESFVEV